MALTKQGIRDLGNSKSKHNLCFDIMNQCSHKNSRACCYENGKPCGHIICPDCDLYIDVYFLIKYSGNFTLREPTKHKDYKYIEVCSLATKDKTIIIDILGKL